MRTSLICCTVFFSIRMLMGAQAASLQVSSPYVLTAQQIDSIAPEYIKKLRMAVKTDLNDSLRRFIKENFAVYGASFVPERSFDRKTAVAALINVDTITWESIKRDHRNVETMFRMKSPELVLVKIEFQHNPPATIGDSVFRMIMQQGTKTEKRDAWDAYNKNYQNCQYKNDSVLIGSLPSLSASYARRFFTPYHWNYAALWMVDDPGRYGDVYPARLGMKFQLSEKMPVITHKYTNSGIYFAMTLRALFDLFLWQESEPVSKKNFMPESWGALDLAWLAEMWHWPVPMERDRNVMRIGAQHESNGGYKEDSRSILVKVYFDYTYSFSPVFKIDQYKFHTKQTYLNHISAKVYHMIGVAEDNKDANDFLGFGNFPIALELAGEHEIPVSCRNFIPQLFNGSLLDFTWMLNPRSVGTDIGPLKKSNYFNLQLEAAWTPIWKVERPEKEDNWLKKTQVFPSLYFRYFRGFNQFLIDYNRETDWFGIGIYMR
jgi:outer membrane phospholipase A